MSIAETIGIGRRLVELCNDGQDQQAVDELYDEKIVSIEGQDMEAMPARLEGLAAVREKHRWWYENHEIHASSATGPFCGHREDCFAVLFETDVTSQPSGERMAMREIALYTVAGGKVVQEEFLYLMA